MVSFSLSFSQLFSLSFSPSLSLSLSLIDMYIHTKGAQENMSDKVETFKENTKFHKLQNITLVNFTLFSALTVFKCVFSQGDYKKNCFRGDHYHN